MYCIFPTFSANVVNPYSRRKVKSKTKIKECDFSSKTRVLPGPIWTGAEKMGNIRYACTVCETTGYMSHTCMHVSPHCHNSSHTMIIHLHSYGYIRMYAQPWM